MKYFLILILISSSIISIQAQNDTSTLEESEEKSKEAFKKKTDELTVPFSVIENVPIYPGCDINSSNTEKKECMSSKIAEFIGTHFNNNIAKNLGLEPGVSRIIAVFNISKTGTITDIRVRADHAKLEEETIRVLKLIPKLTSPGLVNGEPVVVPYSLPIRFQVPEPEVLKYPAHKRCAKIIDNKLLKECTQEKISDFIKLSINYELADNLFPQDKSTQFKVFFTIDKKGNVKDITAKAHHKEMAREVIRVLKQLPKFKNPAMENGKPVEFKYSYLMTIYF
jgi:hypothetical protein